MINKDRIEVNKSKNNKMELYRTNLANDVIPVKKTNKDNINIEINSLFYFDAPVEKDTIIGNLKVCLNGEVIDILEIKNSNAVERKSEMDYIKLFLQIFR